MTTRIGTHRSYSGDAATIPDCRRRPNRAYLQMREDVFMPAWTGAVRHRLDSVINVMRQRDLRRLQLGWTAFFMVDAMSMVALSVWAFDDGGASAVGILGVCSAPSGSARPAVRGLGRRPVSAPPCRDGGVRRDLGHTWH